MINNNDPAIIDVAGTKMISTLALSRASRQVALVFRKSTSAIMASRLVGDTDYSHQVTAVSWTKVDELTDLGWTLVTFKDEVN